MFAAAIDVPGPTEVVFPLSSSYAIATVCELAESTTAKVLKSVLSSKESIVSPIKLTSESKAAS